MASQQPWRDPKFLGQFVDVYGARKTKHLHFLAMRFKRAIITYKSNALDDSTTIRLPPKKVVVFRGKCPRLEGVSDPRSQLIFAEDLTLHAVNVPNVGLGTLLKACFPKDRVVFDAFKNDVLFLVARENPLESVMTKCRKNVVFKTLYDLTDAHQNKRPLALDEVARLRFFKRFDENNLKHFNRWTPFAFELALDACVQTTHSSPSAFLGREIFGVLKRSEVPASPLPPPAFYHCEIMLSDEEFVGVAYALSDRRDQYVDYVSPMVVSRPSAAFRDNSSRQCNAWLPLYKDQATWKKRGLPHYVHGLYYKKLQLRQILDWLELQVSEKYRLMLLDLTQVASILFGERHSPADEK